MVVRRVGAVSLAKVFGVLYCLLGLIIGGFFALFSLLGAGIGAASGSDQAWFGALFGVGAIIFFPILYGVIGFIAWWIGGALYNFVAGMVGGVVVELES